MLLPNFTLTAFATIVDVLRLSADEGDRSRPVRCRWTILGASRRPVTASCGIEVSPWETFGDPGTFDYVIVVGGLLNRGPTVDEATLAFLRRCDRRRIQIAGVCTGSFALAKAGLLVGRKCCVSWYHYPDLLAHVGEVIPVADQLFVQDGRYITCAGGMASLDLGAWIVGRHLGAATVQKSLHIMLADAARASTNAQPQPPSIGAVADEQVRRAVLLIEQRLSDPPRVEAVASAVGLSKRQLERRFKRAVGRSVQVFSRELRAYYGLWLLADTNKSITAVATESGFADSSHFNRSVRALFGDAPSRLRRLDPEVLRTRLRSWSQGLRSYAELPEKLSDQIGPTNFLARERRPYLA